MFHAILVTPNWSARRCGV